MRSALVVIPLFLFVAMQPAATAQSDRIAASIDNRQMVILPGSVYPKAQPQYDRGAVEASLPLAYITLLTKPSRAQQAGLERLLAEQQDPASPNYHKWLTPEQYAGRFGLSQNDVEKLAVWLRSQGFTIVQVARGRNWIAFSGSASVVENAFQTHIHYYEVDGEMHFANATEVSVPASLAGIVSGIRGLHDFSLKPMGIGRAALKDAIFPAIVRPLYNLGGLNFLAPGDIATIYGVAPLYSSGINGTGMKMVVVGQVDVSGSLTDIDNFRTAFGLSKNDPQQTIVPGSPNPGTDSGDMVETKLDLEWAGAVARNATILFITAAASTGGVFNSALYAIDNNLAPVISMSYGACEALNAPLSFLEGELQQANSQGITFLASSGDSGAAACDDDTASVAAKGLAVNYPASSPEVTGVGGSEFNEGGGSYWTGSGSNGGTAISYIPEMGWNDTAENGSLSASGGGASSCGIAPSSICTGGFGFPKPSWQTGAGVPSDKVRDVPDVALAASPDHDGYIICESGGCASGVGTSPFIVGGTSASTPVFAGIITLLNQAVGGTGLGNINQRLYQLAQTSSGVFHDVTTGSNIVPCTQGTTSCPAKAPFQFGYSATAGYDRVTGLGSVDANKLIAAWSSSKTASSTGLTLTASTITAGTSVTFTADVTHTTGTAVPSGTVTFNNGTTKLGSGTLNSSAQATFSSSTLAAGVYSVNAVYGGDTNYLPSTSSADSLTVISKPATSTGLTLTASTITAGTSVTFTADVTHTTGTAVPSGTVTFNNGTTELGSGTLNSSAVATFQTSSLLGATYSVTAVYSGDSNYAGSTSSAGALAVQDFATPTANPTTVSVSAPGQSGATVITITPLAGFSQAVSFSCGTLPQGAACGFSPASVTPSGKAATTTLTITTTAASAGLREGPMGRGAAPFYALLLPGLLGLVVVAGGDGKRNWRALRVLGLAAILCALTLYLPACGGGGGGSGNTGTPVGTSAVTVTATAGTLSHPVAITLSVQ